MKSINKKIDVWLIKIAWQYTSERKVGMCISANGRQLWVIENWFPVYTISYYAVTENQDKWQVVKGVLAAVLMQSNLKLLCQFCKTYQKKKLRHNIDFIIIIINEKNSIFFFLLKTIDGSKTQTHDLSVCSPTPYPLGHGRSW